MRWFRTTASANLALLRIAALILTAGVLILVVASPLALQWLARIPGINWINLSNVGQTYGAISALLTALALGGVVISLFYQARDVKTAREQATRTFHHELLRMEMEDPFYMEILGVPWGLAAGLNDYDSLRRNHFINMWISFWQSQYVLGDMSDDNVRSTVSAELFVSIHGRRYWSSTRISKLKYNKGRRLRFVKIVDEEYTKAVVSGPPVASLPASDPSKEATLSSRQLSRTASGILICVAAGGTILVGRLLGRQFFRRP